MIDLTSKKILLVRNDNIGDLICTTPSIEALRKKYPQSQIDIVVNSYNYDAIHNNPYIDRIYCYTKPKHKSGFTEKVKAGWGKLKILWQIRREGYDAVVVFRSGYSRSAELFSRITNAVWKVGVRNLKGNDDFTIHVETSGERHEVEFCFDCLEAFGVIPQGENTFYFISDELKEKYKAYDGYILFHISSRISENRYSKEKFKEIIDALDEENIIISAEPQDRENAQWLSSHTKAEFIETTSLNDLGGLIANVKLFVTLDGGAMHLAPALDIKTIAISGKTNMDKWYPWGYKELVIQDESKMAKNISPFLIIKTIQDNL